MSVRRDQDDVPRFDVPRSDVSRSDDDAQLSELRQVWSELRAPAPDADVDAPDAETQSVNAWMRAAWASLEAPEVSPQGLPAPRPVEPQRRASILRLLPSTLAVLSTAAAVIMMVRSVGTPMRQPESPAPLVADAEPSIRLRSDGSVELRAGKVRLILVTPTIVSETDTGRTPEIIHSGTEAAGANPEPPMETLTR